MTSTPDTTAAPTSGGEQLDGRYRVAFLDWLGCSSAGAPERAARCARAVAEGVSGRVFAAAVAGHVLDFDDTYVPGLAHLSAATAPVALALGSELGRTIGHVLHAYAEGFEAMGALARRSHPALYERGWHPTAVCGAVGAAVTAAALLGHVRDDVAATASRLALTKASGLRRSFGSDAKSLQVGAAAASGLVAARLASVGATATEDLATGGGGFEEAFGGTWTDPLGQSDERTAVAENWIKAYPCCLQTHGPIDAAAAARRPELSRADAPLTVTVHPRARQAAPYDDVGDGLQAKFSIPYTVAYTLLHGPPLEPSCFVAVDAEARRMAATRVSVQLDDSLPETGASLTVGGDELGRVDWARGSPANPMSEDELAGKRRRLAGARLDGVLDDPMTAASEVLAASGVESDAMRPSRSVYSTA
jgi:2-methylcitrate dehydratase PrpD